MSLRPFGSLYVVLAFNRLYKKLYKKDFTLLDLFLPRENEWSLFTFLPTTSRQTSADKEILGQTQIFKVVLDLLTLVVRSKDLPFLMTNSQRHHRFIKSVIETPIERKSEFFSNRSNGAGKNTSARVSCSRATERWFSR